MKTLSVPTLPPPPRSRRGAQTLTGCSAGLGARSYGSELQSCFNSLKPSLNGRVGQPRFSRPSSLSQQLLKHLFQTF